MTSGFTVQPSELRTAANAIRGVAGQMEQAVSAGGTAMGLSPQAFGILCSFFTPPCLAFSSTALNALGALDHGATRRASSVDGCATDFETADAHVAASVQALTGRV